MHNKPILIWFFIILTLAGCVEQQQDTIRWGFISPLTGTAALYGKPAFNAAQLALEEINSAGGINGQRVELIVEDGECNGPKAVSAAQKMIAVDKVTVIFGGHCSTESMAILPITQEAGVFQMAGDTSTPAYTGKGKYALRTTISSAEFAGKQAELAFQKGLLKVAVLHEERDYPKGVFDAFKKRFESAGGKIIFVSTFTPGTLDFRTELIKLSNLKPDALLISAQGPDSASAIFKQIKEMDLSMALMGDPVTITKGTWANSEGSLPPTAWAVTPHSEPAANAISRKFTDDYTSRFGEMGIDLSLVAENYDGIHLMAEAVTQCKDDNECIRNFILAIKNRTSAVGTISYQDNGDPIYQLSIVRIVNGTPVYGSI